MKTFERQKLEVVPQPLRPPASRDWHGPFSPEFVARLSRSAAL